MRSIAGHMKSEAQILCPDFVSSIVDDVGHAKEAGFRVLPITDKAFEYGHEAGSAQVTSLSALQHQTRDHRYCEIKLFAIVSPAPRHIRPAQVLQIGDHAPGIVDAI